MLQTVTTRKAGPLAYAYNRWKAFYRHEDLGYMGAFLVQVRQSFRRRGIVSEEEEQQICQKLYDEVNELYTQEHWMMVQADLLEQSYSIFTALYNLAKHKPTVYPKLAREMSKGLVDPNKFPIRSISSEVDKYESIWEDTRIMQKVAEKVGYCLEYKASSIDHPCITYYFNTRPKSIAAGNGVFLKCSNGKKYVLPGTLLGFFPGIVFDPQLTPSNEEADSEHPYLKRYDNFRIHFQNVALPFPVRPGTSLIEYEQLIEEYSKQPDYPNHFFYVFPEAINPFALGHKVNHPPTEKGPNAILLDFDIPHTFFPDFYQQYLPYINYRPFMPGTKFHDNRKCFRTVAMVSNKAILDGEELFVDYLYDERSPYEYTPDWLIEPKERHPLLVKKQYSYEPPPMFKVLHKLHIMQLGPIYEEFYTRIGKMHPREQLEKKEQSLFVTEKLRPLLLDQKSTKS